MCLSKLNQLVYGTVALCVAALIIVSMFTPGWRKIDAEFRESGTGQLVNETISRGIFSIGCATLRVNGSDGSGIHFGESENACEKWWKNQPAYEKWVIALMIIALLATLAAFGWNMLTFFCCIGKGGVFRPLPSLAGTATVCLLIATIVYYMNNDKDIALIKDWGEVANVGDQNNVSYSFYLAVAALLGSLMNVVVGSFVVQTAERCL